MPAAAAGPTCALTAAAGDEVSAAIAKPFGVATARNTRPCSLKSRRFHARFHQTLPPRRTATQMPRPPSPKHPAKSAGKLCPRCRTNPAAAARRPFPANHLVLGPTDSTTTAVYAGAANSRCRSVRRALQAVFLHPKSCTHSPVSEVWSSTRQWKRA